MENKRYEEISLSDFLAAEGTEIEQSKYASLLNILKGHEEYILDEQGVILSSNLEAVNITGYEEFEIIGKHISILYKEEEQEKAFLDLKKASRLGKIVVAGLRLKKRKTPFWAKMTLEVRGEAEKKTGFKVTLKDGTHRALANLRVRTMRDEYLSIFNNPFVGTFKFRMADSHVLMWNPKISQITGIDDFSHIPFVALFHSAAVYETLMLRLKHSGKVEGFEFQLARHDDNPEQWGILNCRYFQTQDFVEGILLDITEKKSQLVELERVNHELDQFIYHASHDLRSPLTTMLGLTQLIRIDQSRESQLQYNRLLEDRIHHMDKLLRDLVFVVNNNKSPVEAFPVWFEQEFETILKEFDYNAIVKVSTAVQQMQEFYTDRTRLFCVIRNLISNAIRYSNRTISRPYLLITVRVSPECATLIFEDNGIGIAAEFQQRVFDMFFRASTNSEGSGLGLFIAKGMIGKMGGTIRVASVFGAGSTFTIELPNRNVNVLE
jgi:PAS domain S-box-containing protein